MSPDQCDIVPLRLPLADEEKDYECLLVILTEDGIRGLGEAPVVPQRGASQEALYRELRSGRPQHPAARSAMAMAELDLASRQRGLPAAALLGGIGRPSVSCNALVTGDSPMAVARRVEFAGSAGFNSVKLKSAGLPLDVERLGAARWAAGSQIGLRLDVNGADFRSAFPLLEGFGLELLEQPLPPAASASDWQAAVSSTSIPLAADESLQDGQRAKVLAGLGIGLACKLATVGGPWPVLDLLASSDGPILVSSSYETSIGIAAALAVACALPREPLSCGLATRRLLAADIAAGLGPDAPLLCLPDRPGLGVELDERALARYRLDR
jgi:L-alanine-DL-glutamate epimerase-like enolase superfamily enzyme